MSEPLAHLYALALRALDEQERRADALRGRLAVLAAAALGTSLLGGPIIGGDRPDTLAGTLALLVAVGGLVATLTAAAYVMGGRARTGYDADPDQLTNALRRVGALDDLTIFYETMIAQLSGHRLRNGTLIDRLERAVTAMMCGILVMLCGLATTTIVG